MNEHSGMIRRSCLKMSALSSSEPRPVYGRSFGVCVGVAFSSLDSISSRVPDAIFSSVSATPADGVSSCGILVQRSVGIVEEQGSQVLIKSNSKIQKRTKR
jgi:hypothetical protein